MIIYLSPWAILIHNVFSSFLIFTIQLMDWKELTHFLGNILITFEVID